MTPQIRKILYATDLSKNSAFAFQYALDMAEKYDAKIVILHVIEPIPSDRQTLCERILLTKSNGKKRSKYEQEERLNKSRSACRHFVNRKPKMASLSCPGFDYPCPSRPSGRRDFEGSR